MPRGGQNAKPALQVIREGNPGKRPLKDTVVLPPSDVREPDWTEWFGDANDAETKRLRVTASELWQRVAPTLVRSVGLVGEQQESLVDYCVVAARIKQGERAMGRAVTVTTERGQVKNAWTAPLNQYRAHFKSLACELGLTPSAASKLTRPESSDADDPFD